MDSPKEIIADKPTPVEQHRWQALQLFSLYRLALAISFIAIAKFNLEINFVSPANELMLHQLSSFYLLMSILFLLIALLVKRYYFWQANLPIYVDIVVVILMMHLNGGITSGVGLLLIVVVAAHSILVPGRLSILSAAIATIGICLELIYSFLSQGIPLTLFTQAGLLGIVIFASALITNWLTFRIHKSQLIVENQAQQLATSQQLNTQIIFAMQEGILVLDKHHKIRLVNTSAKNMLDIQNAKMLSHLDELPLKFQQAYLQWLQNGKNPPVQAMSATTPEVRLSFHSLGQGLPFGSLVIIYDAVKETQQAQDLKLASLGQLTAHIAHEIRNPLGASSHAAQLLGESPTLNAQDATLVNIIKKNCDRMNTVIQNVLSLSSRESAHTQMVDLVPWLKTFVQELSFINIPSPQIHLEYDDTKPMMACIDPSQLTQILINLCENGLRYSLRKNGVATITLHLHLGASSQVCLDIIDQGDGIDPEKVNHIFEPFFTTEKTGSGLGLYIARELSQMNGARLDFYSNAQSGTGCHFRLTMSQGDLHA